MDERNNEIVLQKIQNKKNLKNLVAAFTCKNVYFNTKGE